MKCYDITLQLNNYKIAVRYPLALKSLSLNRLKKLFDLIVSEAIRTDCWSNIVATHYYLYKCKLYSNDQFLQAVVKTNNSKKKRYRKEIYKMNELEDYLNYLLKTKLGGINVSA